MLIDSMYEGYQAGTPTVQFTTEQPTGGLFYPYSKRSYNRETGEITTTDGYRILPEGWEKSYYWSFEILNDYVRYFESADGSKLVSDADRQYVKAKLNDLQQEFYSDFVSMQALQSSSNARKLATENGAAMAKKAQQTAQELIAYLQGSEALTRADAVYSLWLRSGSPKAKTSACPFADVSESAYYYDAVLWAAEAGHRPRCQRQQLCPGRDLHPRAGCRNRLPRCRFSERFRRWLRGCRRRRLLCAARALGKANRRRLGQQLPAGHRLQQSAARCPDRRDRRIIPAQP